DDQERGAREHQQRDAKGQDGSADNRHDNPFDFLHIPPNFHGTPKMALSEMAYSSASPLTRCNPSWINFSRIFNRVTPSQRAALAWFPWASLIAWANSSGSSSSIIFE